LRLQLEKLCLPSTVALNFVICIARSSSSSSGGCRVVWRLQLLLQSRFHGTIVIAACTAMQARRTCAVKISSKKAEVQDENTAREDVQRTARKYTVQRDNEKELKQDINFRK